MESDALHYPCPSLLDFARKFASERRLARQSRHIVETDIGILGMARDQFAGDDLIEPGIRAVLAEMSPGSLSDLGARSEAQATDRQAADSDSADP